jgi:peptide chain release factor 2
MEREFLFSVGKKDIKVDFFSGTGAGGQYRNKHQNCVRIKHHDSGVIVTGQSQRDRPANIKEALKNLKSNPQFKVWVAQKIREHDIGKTLEQEIEEMVKKEFVKTEIINKDGKWEEANLEDY